jgi:hypothetical protein
MELASARQEDDPTGDLRRAGRGPADGFRSPIENPAIESIPDDPLLEPHPGEPGVRSDGTAAPLENPDDRVSADPLVSSG